MDTAEDPISVDVILVLQLRTVNDPLLPRLETFRCEEITKAFIPFVPLFPSQKTSKIVIGFAGDSPTVVVASTIARFSTLCPDLERVNLCNLPRDPIITEAVSEMLLGCNRGVLQALEVDSPLTEEAREVVYRLPRLSDLWEVIKGPTSLPTMVLPSLTTIDVEYDGHLNWLGGFRGATLEKLESVAFRTESNDAGDFLGAFESAVLTTTVQNTLSEFRFHTSRSWNPNYSALLSFNQLRKIEIWFSCIGGCVSRVDDDIIGSLARAMPKLEVLRLGGLPCKIPTGITVNGLIGLSSRCPRLSKLCIHLQAASFVEAATSATMSCPAEEPVNYRNEDCALTDLEVGETPIPARSGLTVALTLLQIFPRILNVKYTNGEWGTVAGTIKDFRRIGGFVHRSSKAHPSHLFKQRPLMAPYQEVQSIRTPVRGGSRWRARY